MHQVLVGIPAFHLAGHFFPGFTVYTYGVVLSAAFTVSLWFAAERGKARGISPEKIIDLGILLLAAGVIGSRLLFVLEDWGDYVRHPLEILNLREGGLSIHGGLIAGFLAGVWYACRRKISFAETADVLAPPIALGMGIGRIGCFFNGCCIGIPTKLPWGVVFKDRPDFLGLRHPTEIYEMILDFIIAAVLAAKFRKAKPGTAFAWLWILTGISRFFVEFLRQDAISMGPLSLVQWLCLLIIAAASAALIRISRQPQTVAASP